MPPAQAAQQQAPDNIVDRAKSLALQLQFAWFVGHLITGLFAWVILVIQALFCFFASGTWSYYKAYYGTIISYGIILYKAHQSAFGLNKEFLARLLQDENAQYFLVSLVWATAAPIKVTLIPYAIFSLFHTLGYVRTELIPKLFPGAPLGTTICSQINKFMIAYQPLSINLVGKAEVWVIFPMSIITIFWGGTSIFIPFLYSQFLQFRFLSSAATRQAFADTEVFLDKWILDHASVPPAAKTGYSKAKELIKTYGNLEERARAQAQKNQLVDVDVISKKSRRYVTNMEGTNIPRQEWKQNSIQVAKAAVNKLSNFWPKSLAPVSINRSSISDGGVKHRLPAAAAAENDHQLSSQGNTKFPTSSLYCEKVDLKGEKFQLYPINEETLPFFRKLNLALFPVIYQETFYQNVVNRYPSFLSRIGIAYHNGQAIGAISCRKEYIDGHNRVYIMTIGVLDSCRRFGVGSLLLCRILSACEKDHSVHHVCLHVHVLNSAALAFYMKHGFRVEKRIDNYYERNVIEPPDAYLLIKGRG